MRPAARCPRGEGLAQLEDVGTHPVDRLAAVLEAAAVELGLASAAVLGGDLPDGGALPSADRLREFVVLEERAGLILESQPRLQLAAGDRAQKAAAAHRLGQVVHAGAA